jgi:hypothetical protein
VFQASTLIFAVLNFAKLTQNQIFFSNYEKLCTTVALERKPNYWYWKMRAFNEQ